MLKDMLAHFYSWDEVPIEDIESVLVQFTAAGYNKMVIGDFWTGLLFEKPEFKDYLKSCFQNTGTVPCGSHSPFMNGKSLDIFSANPDSRFIKMHSALLELLPAEFGIKTYTMHIGPLPKGETPELFATTVLQGLELLVPKAEENGIIIALENGLDVNDSPEFLAKYVDYFNSPCLGCCVDIGHANIIAGGPTRVLDDLMPRVVVTHLHDNNGLADQHQLPGEGTVDWNQVIDRLKNAPRLAALENEMCPRGKTPAEICAVYDKLFADC